MKMTEHYTHFDTRQFTEIRDVQAGLLAFGKPEKSKTNKASKSRRENSKACKGKISKEKAKRTKGGIKPGKSKAVKNQLKKV